MLTSQFPLIYFHYSPTRMAYATFNSLLKITQTVGVCMFPAFMRSFLQSCIRPARSNFFVFISYIFEKKYNEKMYVYYVQKPLVMRRV